ncbi:hypothetical protein [Maritalea mediterranea]|uniref:Uncharacterized protein n=1 Tax=Maritalea mediterranea TaxID=2909667 RepID=A0ABS9E6Q7_9HYPH|nr:hypothetical protein [Maritalea mediterranea]MCF4098473.1 hypothetical protein [Maritalea mediterranea]
MTDNARTRAEKHFAALQKPQNITLTAAEQKAKTISDNTARLKALRLAKEAERKPV